MEDRLRAILCLVLAFSAMFGGARADWSGRRTPAAASTGQAMIIAPEQDDAPPDHLDISCDPGFVGSPLGLLAGSLARDPARMTPGYRRLRAALADLVAVDAAGGWPPVGDGPLLRPGERDPRVPALRRRLREPAVTGPGATLYDPALVAAVRSFQVRHGVADDGVVGPLTVAALDVPAGERARQLALNLERQRELPPDRENRHVLVNVPAGTLAMVDRDTVRGIMRAVVGRPDRPTPTLQSRITQLELNPVWNIPHKLAQQDVLPHLHRDPDYWRGHGIRVFATWQDGAPELDPAAIDWSAITPARLAYKLRQEPGPLNPLGRVKFLFANPFSVFIHDTPARERFDSPARFYSSGCVRIEDPDALVAFLLQDADDRFRSRLEAARASDGPRRVLLPQPMPVHFVYWTAWVDADGAVHFRDDVYGRDAALATAAAGAMQAAAGSS